MTLTVARKGEDVRILTSQVATVSLATQVPEITPAIQDLLNIGFCRVV